MRCRRSDKGGRPATGFHNSESTGVLHPASWPARALEARVMRRADKQVGWGPDGWKAAALAAFIVPGASAAWSWAAPIGLELSRRSNIRGSTYFPLLGGMCGHVMSSWSSIARSRLVRVAVHPDAHLRCLGSRSRMAGRPPTLWAAGPHRPSTDHFQCLGQGTAPSHLAQNVQAHEGRSLRGASVQCHDEGECEARPSSSYHLF